MPSCRRRGWAAWQKLLKNLILGDLYPHKFQWPEWPMIQRKVLGKGVAKRIAGTLRVSSVLPLACNPRTVERRRADTKGGQLGKVVGKRDYPQRFQWPEWPMKSLAQMLLKGLQVLSGFLSVLPLPCNPRTVERRPGDAEGGQLGKSC